ncbi:MAG: DNA primase [Sphingomonadales bacterium]|nr:DNA primase [Sphingomonadales bacterium]
MRFTQEFLDELRLRAPLAETVGRKVRLERRGKEYVGLCPFHNEKTPSFTINEQKGFYHCFGCGAHGDVIRFLVDSEGLAFPEAVERLAREAGLEIPKPSPEDEARSKRRASLFEVMQAAADWFAAQLNSSAGQRARDYLERRGLTGETVERFGLGFAPDRRTGCKDALLARKCDEEQLVEAGLLIKPDDGGTSYDRFRDRVMFPIRDIHGRVIAFGGRALGEAKAKYINSPETPLFHKRRQLYNLAEARKAAYEAGEVIVAEGYMDVIALAQAGYGHVVAPLGTALTEEQMAALWRLAPEPVLCFDGDRAGLKAAAKALEHALPLLKPGHSMRFALLPQGQDPDSLVAGEGREAFQAVLDKSVSLADMLWGSLAEGNDCSTPERRAGFEAQVMKTVGEIRDGKVRGFYQTEFRRRLNAAFGYAGPAEGRRARGRPLTGRQGRGAYQPPRKSGRLAQTAIGRSRGADAVPKPMEELLVLTILNHPALLDRRLDDFEEVELATRELDNLRQAIIGKARETSGLDREALKSHLIENGFERLYRRLTEATRHKSVWSAWPEADLLDVEQGWNHTLGRCRYIAGLKREIKEVETELGKTWSEAANKRLKALVAEYHAAQGSDEGLENYGLASNRATYG